LERMFKVGPFCRIGKTSPSGIAACSIRMSSSRGPDDRQ
jgi:hypothetical protein